MLGVVLRGVDNYIIKITVVLVNTTYHLHSPLNKKPINTPNALAQFMYG